jgi:ribonuclease Z
VWWPGRAYGSVRLLPSGLRSANSHPVPSFFDAQLVNGPYGDPALFVDLPYGGRAFLFDMGDLTALPPRKLLRVSDVLISHTHMDHWCGFDHFLRLVLGREKTVRLFGPPGIADRLEHKLGAYCWNLIEGYENDLVFLVTEIGETGPSAGATFRMRTAFAREPEDVEAAAPAILVEDRLRVTATTLDHGIPCLAYAIEETVRVNVWRNRLDELGIGTGPWLSELKELALTDAPDDRPVTARWRTAGQAGERTFTLGFLKERVLEITPGRKLAYVTDSAWTPVNVERIVELARGAEVLFIEGGFLERDREHAAARRHLTAHQAGTLARMAGVKRVVPFHFSPRYADEEEALRAELAAAFGAASSW